MSSHNNNVNLTPQMAAIPNPPQREVVTVFWDYENCPCPMSAKLSNLCYDIKQRIDKFIGKKLNKRIQLYCPMERLQPRTRENATDLGVLCMDVATKRKQESVDKRIIADIGLFAAELAENSGNDIGHIVLVSGDSDFGYILARLRDKSYIGKIVMFVNDFAKDTLTQHADHSCCLFQSNLTRKDNPFSDYNQRKLPNGGGGNNNNNNKSYSMSPSSYTPHSASYHNLPYMSAYHMGHVDDGSGGVGGGGGNNAQWSTYHNYPYGGGYGAAAAEAHAQHYHHQQQHHHHDTTTPQQQQQQQKHAQHNTKHNNSNNGQQSASYTNLQQATVDDEKDKNKLNGANAYVYRRKDKEAAVAAAMALSVSMNNPSSKKLSKKEQKRAMKESGKKRASSKETRQRHHSHSRQQHKHAASTAATSTATTATASSTSTSKQVAGNVLVSSDSNESPRVVSHENLEQQLKQKQKELNEQKQQKERKQQQQQQQHKNGLSLSSHCETAPTVSASSTTTMPSSTKKTSSPSLSPSKLEFGGGQMTSLHENLASDFFAQLMPKEEEMMALLNDMNIVPSTDIFGSTSKLTTTTTTAPKTSSHVINLEQMRSSTAPKGLLLKKKPTTSTSMKVDENSDLNALAKLQQQQQQHQKHQKHKQEHYHPLVSEALVRCEQDGNPTPRRHDIFKAMQKVQPDLMRNKDESFADAAIDACLRGGAVEELIKGRVSSPYLLPLVLHTLTDANASTFYRSYTHQLQKCNHDITQVWIKLGDMAIYLKTRHAQQIDSYFTLAYLHRTIANAADLFAFHKDDRKKNAEQLSEAELGVIRFRLRKRRYMHSDEAQRRRQQLQLQ